MPAAVTAPRTAAQRLQHRLVTNAAPVLGLNSTGAVADMPVTDAVEMDNFISTDQGVQLREGWHDYAINLPGEVRTIMTFEGSPIYSTTSPRDASLLFAATDAGIYDIEGGGDMSALAPMISLSTATFAGRLDYVQFTNDAGKWLIACSEIDGALLFNGVTWTKMAGSGTAGPGVVTGVDPASFVAVCAWKKRLMFVQRGTTVVWILPVGAVGGAAVPFDFGPLLRFGGMVTALVNWTMDAGAGIDDRLVVLGSSGDLLVYEGTDPTNAAAFRNVGVWFVGRPPTGRRNHTTSGGNVFVLTVFGVIPVNEIVQGGLDTFEISSTQNTQQLRKIQGALKSDFAVLMDQVGWEIVHYPARALLHVARPSLVINEFIQYVYQEHTMAWARMLDVPAVTFGRRLAQFYGGTTDGRVLRLFDGSTDGMKITGLGAHEIRGRLTPAFSYFGDPSVVKQSLMARVNFLAYGDPGYVVTMNVDFAIKAPDQAPAPGRVVGSFWNHAYWDRDVWSAARGAYGEWRSVEGMGYALAPTIYVASEQATTIANIQYMVKPGGPL